MTQASDLERYMLDLINAERTSRGLTELRLELNLNESAEDHSKWMLETDIFSHTGVNNSSATQRMRDAGFDLVPGWGTGENIAVQSERDADHFFDDVEDLHIRLMNSDGHRANILNPAFEVIGIGVEIGYYTFSSGPRYSVIVTQNFAYSQGVMDYDDPPVAAAPEPPADPPADPLPEPQPEPQPLVVLGTSGDDQLSGADLNDTLAGGAGDDTLDGGAGADEMKGGDGSDVFLVDNDQDKVLEASAWTGRDEVISTIDWRLGGQHVEDLTLVGQARFGKGNHLDNRIEGNAEDNTLDGQGGNDTLIGGDGNDVYVIRDAGDVVVEASKAGKDKIFATISVELGANIEQVVLRNVFDANGNGVDGLSVTGNGIGNRIHGNNFDNTLIGRGGNDVLTGRAGADTFVFDRGIKANNIDKITDFASGEDRLQFDADIFDALSIGAISAGQLHFGTAAADADDHFIFNEANGVLMYDADGVGGAAAAHIVTLLHGADLSSDDIFIA